MEASPTPPPLPSEPPLMQGGYASCCQGCGSAAPVKQVMFFQHIGAVLLMFNQHIKGKLCRNCINAQFARRTLVTSVFGWWGLISFFLTPVFLLNNSLVYVLSMSMKPGPEQPVRGNGLAKVALVVAILALVAVTILIVNIFRR